jgi:hypothetical protein
VVTGYAVLNLLRLRRFATGFCNQSGSGDFAIPLLPSSTNARTSSRTRHATEILFQKKGDMIREAYRYLIMQMGVYDYTLTERSDPTAD